MRPNKIFLVAIGFLFATALVAGRLNFGQPAHASTSSNEPDTVAQSQTVQQTVAKTAPNIAAPALQNTSAPKAPPAPAPKPPPITPKNSSTKTITTNNAKLTYDTAPKYYSASSAGTVTASENAGCSGSFNSQFLCLINNYRASMGKSRLALDSTLSQVAYAYTARMEATGNFSHIDTNGQNFLDRCSAAHTTCWAENLAMGFTSAQNLFEMWKNSPSHNANMLGNYHSIGIGETGRFAATYFR